MNAILNLAIDVAIFILPLPIISRLNMPVCNRIGLVLLFSIGFFICLITVLRMTTLPVTLRFREPTWESAPTNLWSFIEAAVGVLCACLITLRRAISKMWPKRWRSNKNSSEPRQFKQFPFRVPFSLSDFSGSASKTLSFVETYPLEATDPKLRGKNETRVSHTLTQTESQERIVESITVRTDVEIYSN